MFDAAHHLHGVEWLVDAFDCAPSALRDVQRLRAIFMQAVEELGLHPVAPPRFHAFEGEGGVTGMLMLSESHLTCHTFPERGYAAFDLYCCRERPVWPWAERLGKHLAAARVSVRSVKRPGPAGKRPPPRKGRGG